MTEWWYGLTRGVRNLVVFFPVVWRWRGWDWQHSYDVFMHAIKLQSEHIAEHRIHEGWERDVESMRVLLEDYAAVTGDWFDWDKQNMAWNRIHARLRRDARKWWD